MPKEIQNIDANFVADFKVGDNLVYNSRILCELVSTNQSGLLNKPIVLQAAALTEAALSEIIFRAQNYTSEHVPNISEEDRKNIRKKKIDKLNNIIEVMKKYNLLDDMGESIYDDLHKLRRYRNKIHIQDDIRGTSKRDESELFNNDLRVWALALNERVLKHLGKKFPRPSHISWVKPLKVPS